MKLRARAALVLSAHADDAEFGCAGTLSKLIAAGVEVTSVVFSTCREAVDRTKYPEDVRRTECQRASEVLGFRSLDILEYPVRRFTEHRQDILQELIDIRGEEKYDLVFTHWKDDVHQDHGVIAAESFRAFKGTNTTLLSYEVPLDCQAFSPNVFVPLAQKDVDKKTEAVWCYQSELARRPYFSKDVLVSSLGYRGPFAGTKYAEAFEMRIMVVDSLERDD